MDKPVFVPVTVPSPGCPLAAIKHEEHVFTLITTGPANGARVDCAGLVMEQLYLVCRQCGEAFDSMAVAAVEHKPGNCGSEQGWDLVVESEAF